MPLDGAVARSRSAHRASIPRLLVDEHGRHYRVVGIASEQPDPERRRLELVIELAPDLLQALSVTYRLTRREAHIAELLSSRATNGEIAAELGISRHTARHHTERVLSKLGVTSRAAVRDKLFALAAETLEEEER